MQTKNGQADSYEDTVITLAYELQANTDNVHLV